MKGGEKKRLSRAFAILLTVFMLMGMMPSMAFADEVIADDNATQEEQQLDTINQDDEITDDQVQQSENDQKSDKTLPYETTSDETIEEGSPEQITPDVSNVPATVSVDEHSLIDESGYVHLSVSHDGQFVNGKNNSPMAYIPVSFDLLETIDLEDYGLGEYLYDADGDGVFEITALHLVIYAHENIYGGSWNDVTFTGGPGSSYFAGGIFGFDENLRYDLNGEYPVDEAMSEAWGYTVGATSDHIVLSSGDFLDVAGYGCWGFYSDLLTGFRYFADGSSNIKHSYTAQSGTELSVNVVRTYSDWSGAGTVAEGTCEVSYGKSLGTAEGTVTTDESGCAAITFPSAGTWYVWTAGGKGTDDGTHGSCDYYITNGEVCYVSSPAYAVVTVTANPIDIVEDKIDAIGTVTLNSETAIEDARAAYDALSDEEKKSVENYTDLEAAEGKLKQLKEEYDADKDAAAAVESLIGKIGTVNVHSSVKIGKARTAYDELTDAQKTLVENYETLVDAESAVLELYKEASKVDHKKIYDETNTYITGLGIPTVGSTGGEWMVIDITRAGGECPDGYYENVVDYVKKNINSNEQLHASKSTDNSRVILGLTSAGYNVTDVAGHNLLMGLTDMTYLKKQGINGPIWALIAFDSYDYKIPVNLKAKEQASRDKLVDYILSKQLDNGGWALAGKGYDPDITGMAIQALAPYYNSTSKVKAAVDKALNTLSEIQNSNGGFSASVDGTCSESCAQVIVALAALGINPETDQRFVKNGMSVVDAMCLFALDGGGFAHVPNGKLNGMATEQSQYALAAYYRMLAGKTSLYDMTDVTIDKGTNDGVSEEGIVGDTDNSNSEKENEIKQPSSNKAVTKSLTKSASIKLTNNAPTEKELAKGKENHYCKETGVDARDNSNDILPWYVEINVELQEITDDQEAAVNKALGGDSKMFVLKDIHFTNTKDGSKWQPEKPIKIKLPMADIGNYEHAVIVHITDDGKIEIIKGTVKGDMIEFEADSFSLYGIAGTNASINELLTIEDDNAVIWPWILIAIIALAAIVYLAYRRKREA